MATDKKNDKFTWKKGDIVWEKKPQKTTKNSSVKKGGKKNGKR